jgi:hypothetical protein
MQEPFTLKAGRIVSRSDPDFASVAEKVIKQFQWSAYTLVVRDGKGFIVLDTGPTTQLAIWTRVYRIPGAQR